MTTTAGREAPAGLATDPGAAPRVDEPGSPVPAQRRSNRRLAGARPERARVMVAAALTAAVAVTAVVLLPPLVAGGVLLGLAVLYLVRRIFGWTGMLFALAGVIMFIPIRRYAIPIPLPFALEPYRLLIVILLVVMIVALLIDPAFTWRPVRFGWAIGFFFATMVLSISVNAIGLAEEGLVGGAMGALANLLLVISVFYVVRQILRTERLVMALLTFLAWSGAVIGLLAMFEKVTRTNVFLMLGNFLPLTLLREEGESLRAGGARAYASAQHPIALAVLLCMLIPMAIYLAKHAGWPRNPVNRRIIYGIVVFMLLIGVLAAISRTAVVVMGVMFLVTLVFRPRLAGLLFAFGLPLLLLGSLILPKVVNELIGSFLDVDSLIESQYTSAGWTGAGRLADLEPAMREAAAFPFFGTGLGSRVVIGDEANAYILDNQVLGTLLEAGAVGVLGLVVLVLVPAITLLVFAFRTHAAPRHAQLAFTIAVSMTGYAAALFFYDAFGFMQTFLLFCMLLAVGAWVLTDAPAPAISANAPDDLVGRVPAGSPECAP